MSVRRRQHVSASTYVDGNTVRKVQRTVEIRPERDEREEYRHKHAVRRNQEKALYMNGPYGADHRCADHAGFMYELSA